jgi:hypothetical protein
MGLYVRQQNTAMTRLDMEEALAFAAEGKVKTTTIPRTLSNEAVR